MEVTQIFGRKSAHAAVNITVDWSHLVSSTFLSLMTCLLIGPQSPSLSLPVEVNTTAELYLDDGSIMGFKLINK